jgi:hypothetical protein
VPRIDDVEMLDLVVIVARGDDHQGTADVGRDRALDRPGGMDAGRDLAVPAERARLRGV